MPVMASKTTKTDRDAYIAAYNECVLIYGDPVEAMFAIGFDDKGIEPGVRRAALSDVLSYRYPKVKAVDIQANLEASAGFSFVMIGHEQAERVINGEAEEILHVTHEPQNITATISQDNRPPDYVDPHDEFADMESIYD